MSIIVCRDYLETILWRKSGKADIDDLDRYMTYGHYKFVCYNSYGQIEMTYYDIIEYLRIFFDDQLTNYPDIGSIQIQSSSDVLLKTILDHISLVDRYGSTVLKLRE